MSISNIGVKIVAGALTAGALGGAGYGIYSYNNTTDTVENYLIKNGLTVAKQSDSSFWDKVLKTYKLEKEEFDISVKDENKPDEIKLWCKTTLNKKIKSKEADDFKKASKWCTSYETIKDKLKDKNIENTAQKLNDKLSKFSADSQKEINEIQGITENTHEIGAKIKKWCEINIDRSYSTNEERYFKDINDNCLAEATKGP